MMHEFEYEDRMMGTELSVSIVTRDEPYARDLYSRMRLLGEHYESLFSRFRKESELSRLHEKRAMVVSSDFLDVMLLLKQAYKDTGGAFNPLIDVSRLGYTKDFSKLGETVSAVTHTPYNIAFDTVVVREVTREIVLAPGQHIDVGGFLKGYVAEKMARLKDDRVQGVIVNVGGDLYAEGTDALGNPFVFEIYNPVRSDASLYVPLTGGLATSGSYKRVWKHDGKDVFHILGEDGARNPDTDVVSATVSALHAYDAEVYATVALILGLKRARVLLEAKGYAYTLITTDGNVVSTMKT